MNIVGSGTRIYYFRVFLNKYWVTIACKWWICRPFRPFWKCY